MVLKSRRRRGYLYPYPVFKARSPYFANPRFVMGINTVIKDYGTDILNAIRENDIQRLRLILEKQLRSNGKIAKLCVMDIKHRPTKKFACPMILAARLEDPRIMKYMMDKGADPNFIHHTIFSSKRREVVTALHISVDLSYYDTVETLLNANADPNIADHNKETPLQIAVKKADLIMVRMLLSKGADPSITDRRDNAALHVATLYGHLQMVKMLLKFNGDAYQKGNGGLIPSHIAAREGHIHLVQVFCTRDLGNTNIKIPCYVEQREKAPIHLACEQGHVETVIALIDQFNADVNLQDSDGDTPLHCVVLNPYDPYRMREKDYFYATAKVLIKYHVSINEKNDFGDTALHLAAMNHFQRIVELLLSVGANPFIENDEGLKPIDIVPDSDPVTKQMLKSAMTQPKPPIHASQLSLQRDLDISFNFGNLQPPMPAINEERGILPSSRSHSQHPMFRSNASIHSTSSMASVFVDDVRGQQMIHGDYSQDQVSLSQDQRGTQDPRVSQELRDPRATQELRDPRATQDIRGSQRGRSGANRTKDSRKQGQDAQVYQKMNEIPLYTKVDKKGKAGSRQFLGGEPQSTSSLRSNVQQPDDEWEDNTSMTTTTDADTLSTCTYEVDKMETMDVRNFKQPGRVAPVAAAAAAVVAGRGRRNVQRPKKKEPTLDDKVIPVEDSSEEESSEEESSEEEETSEDEKWQKKRKEQEQFYVNVPEVQKKRNDDKMKIEGPKSSGSREKLGKNKSEHDEDIQIHSIPGRPGTIEVQYSGGPITISVDQQQFDTYGQLEELNEPPPLPDRPNRPKKEEDLYVNQEAMMKHAQAMKSKEPELRATPGRVKEEEFNNVSGIINETTQLDVTEVSMMSTKTVRSDVRTAINQKISELTGVEDEEKESESEEESEEEESEEEEVIEPEPKRKPKPRVMPPKPKVDVHISPEKEQDNESSPQYRSFAQKLALFKNQAESPIAHTEPAHREPEPEVQKPRQPPVPVQRKSLTSATGQELQTKEIRLSSYAAGADLGGHEDEEESESDEDEEEEEVVEEKTEPLPEKMEDHESEEESDGSASTSSSSGNESVLRSPNKSAQELEPYTREPGAKRRMLILPADIPPRERELSESTVSDDGQKPGLNLRVTGEVPKAYDRHSKDSARRAFMQAKPEWVESSSDVSDVEQVPTEEMKIAPEGSEEVIMRRQKDQLKPPAVDVQRISSGSESDSKYKLIGSYMKPYSSFGKIEAKTDLLEEMLAENRFSAGSMEEFPPPPPPINVAQLAEEAAQLAQAEAELKKAEEKLAEDEAKLVADEANLEEKRASLAKSEDDLTSSSGSFDESQEAIEYGEFDDDLEEFLAENSASKEKRKPPRPKLRPGTPPSHRKQKKGLSGITETKEEEDEDQGLLKPTLIAAGLKQQKLKGKLNLEPVSTETVTTEMTTIGEKVVVVDVSEVRDEAGEEEKPKKKKKKEKKEKKKKKAKGAIDDLAGSIPALSSGDVSLNEGVSQPTEQPFVVVGSLDEDIPLPASGSFSSDFNELDQQVLAGFEDYGQEPGRRRPRHAPPKETSIDDDLEVGIPLESQAGRRLSADLGPPPLPQAPPPPLEDQRPLSLVSMGSDVIALVNADVNVSFDSEGKKKKKKKKSKGLEASLDDLASEGEEGRTKKKKKKQKDLDESMISEDETGKKKKKKKKDLDESMISEDEAGKKKKKKKKKVKTLDASFDVVSEDESEKKKRKKKKNVADMSFEMVSEDEGEKKKRKKKSKKVIEEVMVVTNAVDDVALRKDSTSESEPPTPVKEGFESTVMGAPPGSNLERSDTIKKNDSFSKIVPRKKSDLTTYKEEDSPPGDLASEDDWVTVKETDIDSDIMGPKQLVMVGKRKESNVDEDLKQPSNETCIDDVTEEMPPVPDISSAMRSSPVQPRSDAAAVSQMFAEENPSPSPQQEQSSPVHFKRNLGGRRTHPRMKPKKPQEPKDAPLNIAPPTDSFENAAFAAITSNLKKSPDKQKSWTLPQEQESQVRSDMWQDRKDQEADMHMLLQSMSDPASMGILNGSTPPTEKKKPPKPVKPAHLQKKPDPVSLGAYRPQQPEISVKKKPPYSYSSQPDQNAVAGMFAENNKVEVVDVPPSMRSRTKSEDVPFQRQQAVIRGRRGKAPIRIQGADGRGHQSDTEAFDRKRLKSGSKSISFGDVHSDAEAQDYDLPKPAPGKSLEEAALESIQAGLTHQPKLINRRPSSEKTINYTRGVYRPQPVVWRGPNKGSGRYDDSQLVSQMWGDRNRSMTTESEGEVADTEDVTSEMSDPRQRLGSSSVSGVPLPRDHPAHMRPPPSPNRSDVSNVVMRKGRRRKHPIKQDKPLDIHDPDPVDFNKYGMTAQLWMEQVDKKTVQKSQTMYMSLLPEDQQIPDELMKNLPAQDDGQVMMPAQWVIARGRSIRRKKRRIESKFDSEGATTSGGESDWEVNSRSSSVMSPNKQMLLFFKVGGNWQDLAWVLFDGIQSDSETLRLIKDVQLKNKGKLTQQVQDMMRRWWKKKGSDATIEELQRALDIVHMVYIQESYDSGNRSSVAMYTDTEGEEGLDVSGISDKDPEVRRLNREYQARSLNASFDVSQAPTGSQKDLDTDALIQRLEQKRINLSSSFSRSFDDGDPTTVINRSRLGSGRRSKASLNYSSEDIGVDYDSEYGDQRRSFVIVQPQLKPKDYKHETTL